MAFRRVALVTKQRTWLLVRQVNHLRALGHRFGKLELPGVDAFEIRVATCPGRRSTICRSAERAEVDVIDSGLGQRIAQRRLGKSRPARVRNGADIYDPLDTS